MFKAGSQPSHWIVFGLSLAALFDSFAAFAAEDVMAILHQADAYRRPAGSVRVEADVELFRQGILDKERSYTIYTKPGRRSLVLMKSPSEIGQKVLMLGEQFWLLMPDSQRPLRITANQKLLGEASTGDIADMTWSEDYQGNVAGEVDCPQPPDLLPELAKASKSRRCTHLDLNAARPGVTYSRLDLFVESTSKMPIKADLFVSSGKRAKEAWYGEKTIDGQRRIMSMLLLDDIQTARHTVIRYRSIMPKESPDELYNPAALVRNSLAGW
jgi:hypothetical protein